MTTNGAVIRKALSAQEDLIARREHCSVDVRLLGSIGATLGQQLRVRRTASEYALYTVSEHRDEDAADVVRLGLTGRRRLGTDDVFDGAVVLPAADPTMSDGEAEAGGELVERLDDDGEHRGLIVIAPHGGDIEPHTDEQAERVAAPSGGIGSARGGARAGRSDETMAAAGRSIAGTSPLPTSTRRASPGSVPSSIVALPTPLRSTGSTVPRSSSAARLRRR